MSDICLRYRGRFALNMEIKSATTCADRQRYSQFEHDHRRRADRAPQITASFTRDRRRVHWHIWWGKLGSDRIGGEMVVRAACASRPKGSPWTGQSRELVKPHPLSLSENVIDVIKSYQCPNTHQIFGQSGIRGELYVSSTPQPKLVL